MNRLLYLSLFCLFTANLTAQDVTGKWYGTAYPGAESLRITFDIDHGDNGWSARMQSPDQSGQWIPATRAGFRNDTITVEIASIRFAYTGKYGNDSIRGSFVQFGKTYPLNLSRQEVVRNRPQEPKPMYPYTIEEVKFRNENAGITLAGTLTLPRTGNGPFPAVILVSGSGAQDRDETLFGHKPFWVIADYLTQNGIAVLRYDERGVGESEGVFNIANTFDFTQDAIAGMEYLRSRPEIAAGNVGLIGHSEGGIVSFIAAAQGKTDFIVSLAGPGVNGRQLLLMQIAAGLKAGGSADFIVSATTRMYDDGYEIILNTPDSTEMREKVTTRFKGTPLEPQTDPWIRAMNTPWMLTFLKLDPALYFPDIHCPVMALNGGKDVQVPADENLEAIRQGLVHSPDITTRAYPELNHLFQTAISGLPSEYGHIEETFNPEVMRDISDWIKKVTE